MSDSLNLFRLQKLDTSIDKIKRRLIEIDKTLSDDRRVKQAEKKLEKAQAETKEIRINLHQLEAKVEAQKIKRKTDQAALFSGKIKNPKELQDLQMETEALARYITQLEDELLEVMIAHEAADTTEKHAEKALISARSKAIEGNAALLGEKKVLEEDLDRFSREKEAVLGAISASHLRQYNQLRKTKRGIAVAGVLDGCCNICGQQLTPSELQSIRASSSMIYCPSCGRILYEG
jgi:predicted  nucleic acid-binding Zn-ribbon protein